MTSLRFGLNRHFKTKGTDIIKDPEFVVANKIFLARCVDLKRQGLAEVEHKPLYFRKRPSKAVRIHVFKLDDPRTLQNRVFSRLCFTFATVAGKTLGS